jgi:hypothetical protein
MSFVVIVFWIVVMSNFVSKTDCSEEYLRLLVIGDSVDRYMIQDWCKYNNGHMHFEASNYKTNHTNGLTVREIFEPHKSRFRSWEIRVCENYERRIYVSMVSNKFGVKPFPPWHMPLRTESGLESIFRTQNFTLPKLFNLAIVPAFEPIEKSTGGYPHGVMLSTTFWDLSHPDIHNVRTKENKLNWLNSWQRNVTILMQTVRASFPRTKYFAWHTANRFSINPSHWNTPFANELLLAMNGRSRNIANASGYDWIDFYNYQSLALRDYLHPTAESLIRLCDDVVGRMNSSLNS